MPPESPQNTQACPQRFGLCVAPLLVHDSVFVRCLLLAQRAGAWRGGRRAGGAVVRAVGADMVGGVDRGRDRDRGRGRDRDRDRDRQ
eukprot:12898723-Alexandrium_andersonii.AAC.1